jgi:nitroreductase
MSAMDLATVDQLLTTTRAVRKRLDLDRPVPPELIEECLALAVQAPTGGNAQTWRFLVVTDAAKKARLAAIYRAAWTEFYGGQRERLDASSAADARVAQHKRVLDSAAYLAENLHRVPVFVVPCLLGRLDGETSAGHWSGFLGSIFPAIWSFQLALRSRGLGSVLTTLHVHGESEAAEVLGIPDTVTQVALLPVAYTKGTDFKPAARRPASELTYWDAWKAPRQWASRLTRFDTSLTMEQEL